MSIFNTNFDELVLTSQEQTEKVIKRDNCIATAATIGIRITAGVTSAVLCKIIANKIKGE